MPKPELKFTKIEQKPELFSDTLNKLLVLLINWANPNLLEDGNSDKKGNLFAIRLRDWVIKTMLGLNVFNDRIDHNQLDGEEAKKYFETRNQIQQIIIEVLGIKDPVRKGFVREMIAKTVFQSYKPGVTEEQKSGISLAMAPNMFVSEEVWKDILTNYKELKILENGGDEQSKPNEDSLKDINKLILKIQSSSMVIFHEYGHVVRQTSSFYEADARGGYQRSLSFSDVASLYNIDNTFRTLEEIYAIASQYRTYKFLDPNMGSVFGNSVYKDKFNLYGSFAYAFAQDRLEIIFGNSFTTRISNLKKQINEVCKITDENKKVFMSDVLTYMYFSELYKEGENQETLRQSFSEKLRVFNYFLEGGTIEALHDLGSLDKLPSESSEILKGFELTLDLNDQLYHRMFLSARRNIISKIPKNKTAEVLVLLNS